MRSAQTSKENIMQNLACVEMDGDPPSEQWIERYKCHT
ncbi:hypothetical protein AVEN_231067-1, partial [Araneus ventricosus]